MSKKILLSGVKPTGRPHIGNYFGAMKQFVDMQEDYSCMFFLADYHALNFIQNKEEMSQSILDLTLDYLAIGLDPKKSLIYKQSDIPEHAELCWIFDTITTMPYLMRAHAYKDAEAKNKEISVGTFNYPMLMAADILIYDANIVPIGQDQKQHVEYARDTAEKFNRIFGETFILPEAKILEHVAVVPGVDGQKMSKSYGNTIELFATREEIVKAVMSIPTDSKAVDESKDADSSIIFKLYKLFGDENQSGNFKEKFEKGGMGYKEAKEILIEKVDNFISPLRKKRQDLASDPDFVLDVLKEGGARARQKAQRKMEEVREAVGVRLY